MVNFCVNECMGYRLLYIYIYMKNVIHMAMHTLVYSRSKIKLDPDYSNSKQLKFLNMGCFTKSQGGDQTPVDIIFDGASLIRTAFIYNGLYQS